MLSPEELQRLLELAKREIQALKKAALTNTTTSTAVSAVAGSYSCTHCGVMNTNAAGVTSNLPASRVSFSRLQLVDSAVTTPRSTCTGASADSNSELPHTTEATLATEAVEGALLDVTDNTVEVTTPTISAIKNSDPALVIQKKGVEKREEVDRQELVELRVRVQELEGELVAVKMK